MGIKLRFYDDSDDRLDKGRAAFASGDLKSAVGIYLEEPVDSAGRVAAVASAAQILMLLGDLGGGAARAREALAHADENGTAAPASVVMANRVLGECAVARSRYAEAINHFDDALERGERLETKLPEKLGKDEAAVAVRAVRLEMAHTLNSLGGALLNALEPERAIVALERAQRIHHEAKESSRIGYAEVLTHLAEAYIKVGKVVEAGYLLAEALGVAREQRNGRQVARIRAAMANLPESYRAEPVSLADLADGAREAEREGTVPIAYVRWCIVAEQAMRVGDAAAVAEALHEAARLEGQISKEDPNRAMLRLTQAIWCRDHQNSEGLLPILFTGASEWLDLLGRPIPSSDVEQITRKMHEHFRVMASALLQQGRSDEALCAFEIGRGLAHAIEAHAGKSNDLLATAGFSDSAVSTLLLENARKTFSSDGVLLVFAILPGEIVAFVIGHAAVETARIAIPVDHAKYVEALSELPKALDEKKGEDAVPEVVRRLAADVARLLGARRVEGLFPHALLHVVPWRILLWRNGVPWERLAATTEFGLMSRALFGAPAPGISVEAVALGYGEVKGTDFANEAIDFAIAWGEGKAKVEAATVAALRQALSREVLVHLSCHGIGIAEDLRFLLSDGSFSVDEVLDGQSVVAPTILLSACFSGTYFVRFGDYPRGAAPRLLRAGARACLATRFPIDAPFAAKLLPEIGKRLGAGETLPVAFAGALAALEKGADLWSDLACVEIVAS